MDPLTDQQIAAEDLADWRKLGQAIHARYLVPGLSAGAAFVEAVARAADEGGHRPDIRLTDTCVDLAVCTRVDGIWVRPPDIGLARRISEIAAEHGVAADPGGVTQLELALDTADHGRVAPFWSALLTGSPDNGIQDSVFDPTGRVPALWFQGTDPHGTPRQRWHFDVWLAPEVVDERIAAAVAAGGTVVDDSHAPSFTVLADADGNKACICTTTGRP